MWKRNFYLISQLHEGCCMFSCCCNILRTWIVIYYSFIISLFSIVENLYLIVVFKYYTSLTCIYSNIRFKSCFINTVVATYRNFSNSRVYIIGKCDRNYKTRDTWWNWFRYNYFYTLQTKLTKTLLFTSR